MALAACVGAFAACATARPPTRSEATPGLVFPARFAEGSAQDAGAAQEPNLFVQRAKRSSSPPDPEPLRQAEQYEYTFAHEDGRTTVATVRAVKFPKPVVTARKMGRFAVELWVGNELVERVRFDFPLLAAEEPRQKRRRPLHEPPSLAGGVLRATVLVPAAWRARRAVLLDRATNVETELEWPPRLGEKATASDAGVPSGDGAASDAGVPSGDGAASEAPR